MGLVAKATSGSNFVPVPAGMHLARCYRIIDLGTQKTTWQGTEKHLPKVMLQFEVHGNDESGKPIVTAKNEPMTISKNFTNSLGEKATLRQDLKSWRGRDFTQAELNGFELKNVLGAWAMITVATSLGQDGKEYTNITNINPVPSMVKQAGLPEGFNKTGVFWIEEPDMDMFETFGDGLKKKIESSPEWQNSKNTMYQKEQMAGAKSGFEDMVDDVPF
jgi:hypothetical protein